MADVQIDVTADDGEIEVTNPLGFDLRLTVAGVSLDITHDQAAAIYRGLQPFFDAKEAAHV